MTFFLVFLSIYPYFLSKPFSGRPVQLCRQYITYKHKPCRGSRGLYHKVHHCVICKVVGSHHRKLFCVSRFFYTYGKKYVRFSKLPFFVFLSSLLMTVKAVVRYIKIKESAKYEQQIEHESN